MSDICKCGHGHMVHVRWDYPLDDDDSRLWTCTHTNCGCREYQPQFAPTAEERFTAEYVGTACPCHNKMLCPNDLNTTITTTAPTGVEESDVKCTSIQSTAIAATAPHSGNSAPAPPAPESGAISEKGGKLIDDAIHEAENNTRAGKQDVFDYAMLLQYVQELERKAAVLDCVTKIVANTEILLDPRKLKDAIMTIEAIKP